MGFPTSSYSVGMMLKYLETLTPYSVHVLSTLYKCGRVNLVCHHRTQFPIDLVPTFWITSQSCCSLIIAAVNWTATQYSTKQGMWSTSAIHVISFPTLASHPKQWLDERLKKGPIFPCITLCWKNTTMPWEKYDASRLSRTLWNAVALERGIYQNFSNVLNYSALTLHCNKIKHGCLFL